jgi:hypothetical protein
MKKIAGLLVLMLVFSSVSYAQFRNQLSDGSSVESSLFRSGGDGGSLFGFFNPANFSMRQSISMNYMTMGGQSMSLAMYTNSMSYRISQPLTLSADVSVMNSPYSTLGNSFSKSINGIYLTRAELNYRPTKDFSIDVQFNQNPLYRYYNPYYYYGPMGW